MEYYQTKTINGAPIWSECVSQTEAPIFTESTSTSNQKIIFENTIL